MSDAALAEAYSHLLGAYLGDGCLCWTRRGFDLRISCDARQPAIMRDIAASMTSLFPSRRARLWTSSTTHQAHVSMYWKHWPELFPQHGPGRKHERRIELEPWQESIVERWPWDFLRGLLHSDGCRSINRVRTTLPSGRRAVYEYPRWYFVNASEDILGIFGWACNIAGVDWTRSRERMITISTRASVALLDERVGMKG